MAIKINEITGCRLHTSTVRRWLPAAGLVWRRAAPTLRIRDPHKDEKMAAISAALEQCSQEHPVFYEDEVDIHLNPKIGADWQVRGQQKLSLIYQSVKAPEGNVPAGENHHTHRGQLHYPQEPGNAALAEGKSEV